MTKIAPLVLLLLLAVISWLFLAKKPNPSPQPAEKEAPTVINSPIITEPQRTIDDLSSNHMTNYGHEQSSPQDDVLKVAKMLQSFSLIVKSDDPLPFGENREIVSALTGKNAYRTRVLSPDSPWLNKDGELVDRWGTALYFHGVGEHQLGVRSAGPDRQIWTSDDIIDGPNSEPLK